MRALETNDWMILNSIIYKIYTTGNTKEMRRQFLEQMKMVIDYDSADFYLASENKGKKLVDPITYNCDEDYSQEYEDLDYSRGIMYGAKSMVYRESDIISDKARKQTDYYLKVYKPNNWHYSLQMILARNKIFLGVITFYRIIGKEDFHYDDIFRLDMLKDHLSFRLYQDYQKGNKDDTGDKITVTEAAEQYDLTKREHTILKLLMEGIESADICDDLSISLNTLKKHTLNIYRKLGIKNRVALFKMIKENE